MKQFRPFLHYLIRQAQVIILSAETTLAMRSLQMARAWSGKYLEYSGEKTPYVPSDSVPGIPDTADTSAMDLEYTNHSLAAINYMRAEIQEVIDEISDPGPAIENSLQSKARSKCIEHLTEARFWYGYELERMKEGYYNPNPPQRNITKSGAPKAPNP